jgi:hypothetical protein
MTADLFMLVYARHKARLNPTLFGAVCHMMLRRCCYLQRQAQGPGAGGQYLRSADAEDRQGEA